MIKVSFFAYYRDKEYAGCKELTMETPENLLELGKILSDKFGDTFRNEFFSPDGNDIGERTIVFINGRSVNFLGRLNAPIKDNDHVLIFPVVAGG